MEWQVQDTLSHTHTHAMPGKIRRQKLTHTFSHTHKLALDGERERNTLEKKLREGRSPFTPNNWQRNVTLFCKPSLVPAILLPRWQFFFFTSTIIVFFLIDLTSPVDCLPPLCFLQSPGKNVPQWRVENLHLTMTIENVLKTFFNFNSENMAKQCILTAWDIACSTIKRYNRKTIWSTVSFDIVQIFSKKKTNSDSKIVKLQ